jgi:hypothetical protein
MPVRETSGGWTFGGGTFDSKAKAERSYQAYLAKKHDKKKKARAAAAYQAWKEKR